MRHLLIGFLILESLTVWTIKSEARILEHCARAFTKPEPFLIKTEQQLRDEGYEEKDIAGLDHARSNLELAHRLRTGSIHPTTTHIEEFADLIDAHIAFIERGIRSQNYIYPSDIEGKALRLEQLERLKSEAQMRKDLGQVTYEWWFFFNLRLAIAATTWTGSSFDIITIFFKGSYSLELMTDDGIKKFWNRYDSVKKFWNRRGPSYLLNDFPKRILIPTIQDLSRMAINETYGTGVHLIGLINDDDSAFGTPIDFALHDIFHATRRNIDKSEMAKRVMLKKANLPRYQRIPVEWMFFEFTHEKGRKVHKSLFYHLIIDDEEEEHGIPVLKKGQPILIQILKDSFWESRLSMFPWLRI